MNPPADGADRMRHADRIIVGVTNKLEAHRAEISRASVIHITCRLGKNNLVEVTVQATYS